jgi:hypothetical protein
VVDNEKSLVIFGYNGRSIRAERDFTSNGQIRVERKVRKKERMERGKRE